MGESPIPPCGGREQRIRPVSDFNRPISRIEILAIVMIIVSTRGRSWSVEPIRPTRMLWCRPCLTASSCQCMLISANVITHSVYRFNRTADRIHRISHLPIDRDLYRLVIIIISTTIEFIELSVVPIHFTERY